MNIKACGLLVCLALPFAGCTTVPETGRTQFNVMSAEQEMELGFSSFEQLKSDTPISRDPDINAMVQRVGQRIAAVANLPGANWEFVVFDSPEANAFCLPGGKVGVFTGILPITKDEAGLATVIGHEVAHAVARHGGERMSQALALQLGGQVLGAVTATTQWQGVAVNAYGLGAQLGVALPHNRKQEAEADYIGLLYMARAGYDPVNAVAFWTRFAEYNRQQGGGAPWFLRTHPLDDERIREIVRTLPKARDQYRPR
ncbi:MAG: M48 family metalloprotease [Gammaproteobacteria bacterium]|jgi:predicted Zn-dependent protease|nr:M48 family metalloprotease [Gammaproteobacteria bacterium]